MADEHAFKMDKLKNKLYMEMFFKTMKNKILEKAHKFPEYQLDKDKLFKATKFRHLEYLYNVPVFGFDSPEDYWEKASSKPYLSKIIRPTLLINAKDDTFLSRQCFPYEEAENSAVGQERDWNDHNYAEPAIDHDGLLCRNSICSTQI